ncbi:hypothetical protein J5N97_007556 [Dioscorea zingiberensis]|uniref:Uncharacterized protein n=1 Tax=Dioscorea zingiberensis TaxID=325984 RepID=A0A9D5DEE4_9LILI|nr:hypothetical protein J5N97_007556 [Dioscorea zingiberensis]
MCHELLCCFRGNDYDNARRDGLEDNRNWDVKPPSTVNGSSNSASLHVNDDTEKPLSPFPQGKQKEMKQPDEVKAPSTLNGSSNSTSLHANDDTEKSHSHFPQEKQKEMKQPDEVKAPSTLNGSSNSASLHANDDTEKSHSHFPQGKPKEMKQPDEFPMIMKPVGANHKDTEKTSSGPEEVSKKNIGSRVQSADKKDQISAKSVLPAGKGFTANEEVPRKPAAFIYDK